jgi:hypothetical protein
MGQLFLTARTVGEALEKFTHYFPVLQSNTQCSLRVEDAVARLSYSIRDSTIRHRSQDANFTELVFCSMLVALLGDDWRPSSVRFEHLPGSHFELYKPYFHCSISFGERENAIQFSARDLDTAIPHSNHIAHSHAEAAIREPRSKEIARLSFSAGIKAWIIESLSNPTDIDIETAVTRHLGVRIRNSVL